MMVAIMISIGPTYICTLNRRIIINYMIVTQDLVCNSILSLHLGRGVVSSVRMVSLARMVRTCMSGQKGKVHLGPNVSSSAHDRGCVVNGSGAMAAI